MKQKKRIAATLMAFSLLFSVLPRNALAVVHTDTSRPCGDHPVHTTQCGYAEEVPGTPCTHIHTEECDILVTNCVHMHTAECYPQQPEQEQQQVEQPKSQSPGDSITSVPLSEESPLSDARDVTENSEPSETDSPTACAHECSEESDCITREERCKHKHDESCGYTEGSPASPCTFVCEICNSQDSDETEAQPDVFMITGFEELTEDVWEQTVPLGTAEEQLKLPDTLSARGYAEADENAPTQLTIEGIQWKVDPTQEDNAANGVTSYASAPVGSVVLTAVLPPHYALESGVQPPEVIIFVQEKNENSDLLSGTISNVPYLDADGVEQLCPSATVVDSNTTEWGSAEDQEYWYVVSNGDITIDDSVEITGNVHLILQDDASLTVRRGFPRRYHQQSLTIYGQNGGTGSLNASAYSSAISNVTINGGTVHATGGQYAIQRATINGGTVTAIGGAKNSWGIGEATINGGTVVAEGRGYASAIANVTINGGTVTAAKEGFSGTVRINGGTVETRDDIHGWVTISGGTVTADGAISGKVIIEGGTVTAGKIQGRSILSDAGYEQSAGGPVSISNATVETGCISNVVQGVNRRIVIQNSYVSIPVNAEDPSSFAAIDAGFNATNATLIIERSIVMTSGLIVSKYCSVRDGSVVFAYSIWTDSNESFWNGVFFRLASGQNYGQLYGSSVAPTCDFTIPEGYLLEIEEGKTLDVSGVTVKNLGRIDCHGSITGAVSGDVRYSSQMTLQILKDDVPSNTFYYGDTITLVATIQPKMPAALQSEPPEDIVEFKIAGTGGKSLGTSDVIMEDGVYTAELTITLTGKDWYVFVQTIQAICSGIKGANGDGLLGNYALASMKWIDLLPITENMVHLNAASVPYNGTEQEPDITVTRNDLSLMEQLDYTVNYADKDGMPVTSPRESGVYTVTIAGTGRCTGEIQKTFTITPTTITEDMVVLNHIPSGGYFYDGTEKKPTVTVEMGNRNLTENIDYTVTFTRNGVATSDFTSSGVITVTITGIGNCAGEIQRTFTISQSDTVFEGSVKTYHGEEENDSFTYGETITVKVTPKAIGNAPASLFAAPQSNQMAIYHGASQLTAPQNITNGQEVAFDIPALDVGSYTLTAKYVGNDNMADQAQNFDVTVHQKALTITGAALQAKTYDGSKNGTVESVDLTGLENGETLDLGMDYIATAEYDRADAGIRTADVTVTLQDTQKAKNYSIASSTYTLTGQIIAKADGPTVPNVTGNYKVDPSNTEKFVYTVNRIEGAEYSRDGSSWQDSNMFSNIVPGSAVVFYARIKETSNVQAGAVRNTGTVTFEKLDRTDVPELIVSVTGNTGSRTVMIGTVEGAEYKFGNDAWGSNNTKSNVTGMITVSIRYATTATLNASIEATQDVNTDKQEQEALQISSVSTKTYGDSVFLLSSTGGSGNGAITWSVPPNNGVLKLSGNKATIIGVGKTTVTAIKDGDNNYEDATAIAEITVVKASPAVNVNVKLSGNSNNRTVKISVAVEKVGDGVVPTRSITLTSNGLNQTVELTNGIADYAWTGLKDQEYTLSVQYTGDDNYQTVTTSKTFNSSKKTQEPLVITDVGEKTYGDTPFELNVTGGSGTGVVTITSSDSSVLSIEGTKATIHKADSVIITAVKAEDTEYSPVSVSVNLTIQKVVPKLTLTPSSSQLSGGGTVTLTLTGVPKNGSVSMTCSDTSIQLTKSEGNTWITSLPNKDHNYTFTTSYAGDENHNEAAAACEVTVIRKSSGGGGSSNSGSGSTINPPNQNDPNSTTTGETKPVTPDKDGDVSIDNGNIQDAIDKAEKDAEKKDVAVMVPVKNNSGHNELTIRISTETLDTLVNEKVKWFTINTDNTVDFRFTQDTLKELNRQTTGDIVLKLEKTKVSSQEAKTAIGSRPVYDITLWESRSSKETPITELNGKTVSISIPHTPVKGESTDNLYAVYVDGSGKVEWLTKSSYDADQKAVIFEAEHFSIYGVGYKTLVPAFTDIESHWAKEHILFTVSRGLFSGTSETTFSPNTTLTRGMFVTVLGRLGGIAPADYQTSRFIDVKADAYYAPYVNWAAKMGIVDGITATTFSPDSSITREQMAAIMKNYADKIGYSIPKTLETVTFSDDVKISSWGKDAVKAMQQAGVLSGKTGNVFEPQGKATRAEATTVLHRFVEVIIQSP